LTRLSQQIKTEAQEDANLLSTTIQKRKRGRPHKVQTKAASP
jgi:predicted transcriptional regulator